MLHGSGRELRIVRRLLALTRYTIIIKRVISHQSTSDLNNQNQIKRIPISDTAALYLLWLIIKIFYIDMRLLKIYTQSRAQFDQ